MRKIKLLLLLTIVVQSSCAQSKLWKSYEVNSKENFHIPDLNTVVDFSRPGEPPDTVKALLIVDNDSLNTIRFTRADLVNGIITITIYETNEANHHVFAISISGNKYDVSYKYISSGESEEDGVIEPLKTDIILNTNQFFSGQVIKGYAELHGKCRTCSTGKIDVKGNFQVRIK